MRFDVGRGHMPRQRYPHWISTSPDIKLLWITYVIPMGIHLSAPQVRPAGLNDKLRGIGDLRSLSFFVVFGGATAFCQSVERVRA